MVESREREKRLIYQISLMCFIFIKFIPVRSFQVPLQCGDIREREKCFGNTIFRYLFVSLEPSTDRDKQKSNGGKGFFLVCDHQRGRGKTKRRFCERNVKCSGCLEDQERKRNTRRKESLRMAGTVRNSSILEIIEKNIETVAFSSCSHDEN